MGKKGFTLVEVLVTITILGILASIAIPNYTTMMEQGMAQAAVNNLITIYGAERNYFFNKGIYCTTVRPNTTCANNLTNINMNLSLNIADSYFSYWCPGSLSCFAQRKGANTYLLYLDGSKPLVSTGWPSNSNPSCIVGQCPSL